MSGKKQEAIDLLMGSEISREDATMLVEYWYTLNRDDPLDVARSIKSIYLQKQRYQVSNWQ